MRTGLAATLLLAAASPVVPPEPDLAGMEPQVASYLTELRAAVVETPGSAETWGALGGAYDAHRLLDPAETCYRTAMSLAPSTFDWAYLLAIVRDVNGADSAEVTRAFDGAARLRADYAPLHLRQGRALAVRGEYADAERAFRRAAELDTSLAAAWLGLGQALLAADDPERALVPLERASTMRPDDGAALTGLAQAYRMLGRPDEAAATARRSAGLVPRDDIPDPVVAARVTARGRSARHFIERADGHVRRQDWSAALADYRKLLEIRPGDAHTHYSIGSTLARLGHTDEARVELDRALALDPEHAWARFEIAAQAESAGRYAEARDLLEQARRLEPRESAFALALARVCAADSDPAGVVRAYEALAEVEPVADPRALSNWGNALLRLGRTDEAIDRYEQALALDPTHANAHYNLALALERAGRTDAAIEHYRAALRIDPAHPAANRLRQLGTSAATP